MANESDKKRNPATTHVMSEEQRLNAFNQAIKLWPDRIDTSEKEYLPGDGCSIPALGEAWDNAEIRAKEKKDSFGGNSFEEIDTMSLAHVYLPVIHRLS